MPKPTKLSIAAIAIMLGISSTAIAQDKMTSTQDGDKVDIFTSSDSDTDGVLDRDEFVSFVVMKSDAGDAVYASIKLAGSYDDHFNTKDYNADGVLSTEELSGSIEEDADERKHQKPAEMHKQPG